MIICNVRKKMMLKLEDVYFSDDYVKHTTDCDIIVFLHSKLHKKNAKEFYTLFIDLTKDPETLYMDMRRSYRQQIRKAIENSSLKAVINNNPLENEILEYVEEYNAFAKMKNLKICDYKLLKQLSYDKSLMLSYIKDVSGTKLCGHLSLLDKERVYCFYSYSSFRNFVDKKNMNKIAGVNKYLHWSEIIYSKEKGMKIYDFGGLALNENDELRSKIDYFKKGFGGSIVKEYNFYYGKTLRGKLALGFLKKNNCYL